MKALLSRQGYREFESVLGPEFMKANAEVVHPIPSLGSKSYWDQMRDAKLKRKKKAEVSRG